MRKWILFVAIMIMIGVTATTSYGLAQQSDDVAAATTKTLLHSLQSAHATLTREDVSDWSTINHTWTSTGDLTKLADQIALRLHVTQIHSSVTASSTENSVNVHGKTASNDLVNVIVTSLRSSTGSPLTVLSTDITDQSGVDHLQNTIKEMQSAVNDSGIHSSIRALVRGYTPDVLKGERSVKLIQQTFQKNGIQPIEAMSGTMETSISGYIESIPESIETKGHRMNIQMAAHYNTEKKQTEITIGTPIITIEY